MSRKGLFLFAGECFREGQPCSRVIDTNFGVETQIVATESHIKLIDSLEHSNFKIDVVINTCESVHKELLLGFYKNVIYANFTKDRPFDRWGSVFAHALHDTAKNVDFDKYEFIFICRLDILLKPDLIASFNPEWQKITYPNVMSIDPTNKYSTIISDLFCFIPSKYIKPSDKWGGLLQNAHRILHHYSIDYLLKAGLTLSDVGFMTNRTYVANTFQLKNPLYAIVCRPEGPDFYEGYSNKRYVPDLHLVVDESFECRQ